MKQTITKLTTFDDILEEAKHYHSTNVFTNLKQWLKLISSYYLSGNEVNVLNAMRFCVERNKKQRETSVFFDEPQRSLRRKLNRVNFKIAKVYRFLSNPRIHQEYVTAGECLNLNRVSHGLRQFNILKYVLAGHRTKVIAEHLKVTRSNIYVMVNHIINNLIKFQKCSLIKEYLISYKCNFKP